MKCVNSVVFALLVVLCTSCQKSTEPPINDLPPPGIQEDIPWSSLADSPWPMSRHDPQSTGRSKEIGPELGIVDWSVEPFWLETGISIGPDSSIYITYADLYAYSLDGAEKWILDLPYSTVSAPIIAADGTIYTTAGVKLIAISPEKLIKWEYIAKSGIGWMINIGKDGVIYILDPISSLCAISPSGTLLWQYSDGRFTTGNSSGMSFSPDGTTLYLPGSTNSVIAFDIQNKSVKWVFGETVMYNPPVVDSNGNIYILPKYDEQGSEKAQFYSLNKSGGVRWVFDFNYEVSYFNSNTPTIDKAGNVYFATDTLYSLDYSGNLNWKVGLEGFSDCPLVCDVNSNIFVGTMGTGGFIDIYKFDSDGNKKWKIRETQEQVGGSPAIGFSSLYFPTWKSTKIYSIN